MAATSDRLILFRCDASPTLGGGHAMRCLALADAFAGSGATCVFAVNPGATDIVPGLVRHRVIEVDGEGSDEAGSLARAFREGVDLLIVDHYHRDDAFETACRSFAREVLVIDDLADRAHDCDWLVDPTLGRRPEAYAGLVPESCRLLLGPDYALLRPEFAALRPQALARREAHQAVERILISFGASDPHDLCGTLLGPLLEALPDVSFDVVTGGPPSPATRAAAERGGTRVRLIRQTADMAYLMAEADFAIGACGGTSWERCALGLPAAVVITAENQREIAAALVDAGAVRLSTAADLSTQKAILEGLCDLVCDESALVTMARNAASLCDGDGISRILERHAIATHLAAFTEESGIALRFATPADEEALYQLQIEPGARAESRNPEPPERSEHAEWYQRLLCSGKRYLLVVTEESACVGYLRLDGTKTETVEVSILLCRRVRGRDWASKLIGLCRRLLPRAELEAVIHARNVKSMRSFQRAGFVGNQDMTDGFFRLKSDPLCESETRSMINSS